MHFVLHVLLAAPRIFRFLFFFAISYSLPATRDGGRTFEGHAPDPQETGLDAAEKAPLDQGATVGNRH
jgi:hypothetical protein